MRSLAFTCMAVRRAAIETSVIVEGPDRSARIIAGAPTELRLSLESQAGLSLRRAQELHRRLYGEAKGDGD